MQLYSMLWEVTGDNLSTENVERQELVRPALQLAYYS